jgi:proline dehydrogenase
MIGPLKNSIRFGVNYLAKKASRNYISGPEQNDAQKTSAYLVSRGYWITQGYWDGSGDSANEVLDNYLKSMEGLSRLRGNNYISIKIPSLDYDLEKYQLLKDKSGQTNVAIHFDSLAPEHADRIYTFILNDSKLQADNVGITLPGRWKRSIRDTELANDLGVNVRVVKGQWQDPDEPDFDPTLGFLQLIEQLAGRAHCVRVATHNLSLAKESLKLLKEKNTPCELELLYGLPVKPLISLAGSLNVPVRIYVAFGNAYLPYAISSIRRKPGGILLLVRDIIRSNYISSFSDLLSTDSEHTYGRPPIR